MMFVAFSWIGCSCFKTQNLNCVHDRGEWITKFVRKHRQEFVFSAVQVRGYFGLSPRPLQLPALRNIANVALDHRLMVQVIHIADKFYLHYTAVPGLER